MLYVTTSESNRLFSDSTSREHSWHTGEVFPVPGADADEVVSIQADGDELMVILSHFDKSIPSTNDRVQAWYGDIAASIAFFLACWTEKV